MLSKLTSFVSSKSISTVSKCLPIANKIFATVTTFCVCDVSMAAAPSAADTNAKAGRPTGYLINILQGEIGYLIALAAFASGIFVWFKSKSLLQTLSCFGLSIAIIIVPITLEGAFTSSNVTGVNNGRN